MNVNIEDIMNELENVIPGNKKEREDNKTSLNLKEDKLGFKQNLDKILSSVNVIKKLNTYKQINVVSVEDIDYLKTSGNLTSNIPNIYFTVKPSASGLKLLKKTIAKEEEATYNTLMELLKSNSELMIKYVNDFNSNISNYKNLMSSLGSMKDRFSSKLATLSEIKYTKTKLNGKYINLLTFPINNLVLDKLTYDADVNPTFQQSLLQIKEIFDNPCFKQLIQNDDIKDICGMSDQVSVLDVMQYFTSGRANLHVSELKSRLDQLNTNFLEVSSMTTGSDDITYYEITYRKLEELHIKAFSYIGFINNIVNTITPITVLISNFDVLLDE